MGDRNQLLYLDRFADRFQGPYLEVGSKQYGSTQDLRSRFGRDEDYVGLDLESGEGVDVLLDLTLPFEQVDRALGGRRFGTIFCLSVLEHCRQPFQMAENLTRLLQPGGRLCLSAPFAWRFHGYPSDYWRFTHEGVKVLFPGLTFADEDGVWATSQDGEFYPLSTDLAKISLGTKIYRRGGRWNRWLSVVLLRLLGAAGLFRWLTAYRYVLAPTNVMMVGMRKE